MHSNSVEAKGSVYPRLAWLPGMSGRYPRLAFLVWLAVFNCVIGLCFRAGEARSSTLADLILANCIGFSAWGISQGLMVLSGRRMAIWLRVLIIAPGCVLVGTFAGSLLDSDVPPLQTYVQSNHWLHLLPTLLIAGVGCGFISVMFQAAQFRADLETQRREAAELRQSETAARLAMLQAQIEPHFLFNTLANVQSLIGREPDRAVQMLDNLNRYLRASLGRTRKPESLLAEELELVDALLQIAQIRLGDRLDYVIDVPEALRQRVLPPLLLQPLVENALLHGIEPAIDGGRIVVRAAVADGMLTLQVTDTGVGLGNSNRMHSGVGLANIRARLKAIYGDRASLSVGANAGQGVSASLLLPVA